MRSNSNIGIVIIVIIVAIIPLVYQDYTKSKMVFDDDSVYETTGAKEEKSILDIFKPKKKTTNSSNNNQNTTNNNQSSESNNQTNNQSNDQSSESNNQTAQSDPAPAKQPNVAVKDVIYEELSLAKHYASGDYSKTDGTPIENGRRFRYLYDIKVRASEYHANIVDNVAMNIFEFDGNNRFIRTLTIKDGDTYKPSSNAKYFKVSINKISGEKSMSNGQWNKFLGTTNKLNLYNGDINALVASWKGNLYTPSGSITQASTLTNMIKTSNTNLANALFTNQTLNGAYTLNSNELGDRLTLFFSTSGNDNNSGLSPLYPKQSFAKYAGAPNVNYLLKAGDRFYLSGGIKPASDSLYATYGIGKRAAISFYKPLNVKFTKVSGYDNIWVADIASLSNGTTNKSNCNLGQLLINGKINWNRYVYSSDSDIDLNVLVRYANDGWSVDFKRSKLYIYTKDNPNNFSIAYAPSTHGVSISGATNVVFKGIEIEGAGNHAINITNSKNVKILNNYIHDIGGSVLTSAGIRYGNAVQVWDNADNITVAYNIADWIFDTCYTNQGSKKDAVQKNILVTKNVGMHSFWGIEVWGDSWSSKPFSNIEYSSNIINYAMDITAPTTTMYTAPSGKLLHSGEYVSYRGGYQYHQMSNLETNNSGTGEVTRIKNNVFSETNRFLYYINNSRKESVYSNLENNTFYNSTKNAVFRVAKTYTYEFSSIISPSNQYTNPDGHMNRLLNAMSGK